MIQIISSSPTTQVLLGIQVFITILPLILSLGKKTFDNLNTTSSNSILLVVPLYDADDFSIDNLNNLNANDSSKKVLYVNTNTSLQRYKHNTNVNTLHSNICISNSHTSHSIHLFPVVFKRVTYNKGTNSTDNVKKIVHATANQDICLIARDNDGSNVKEILTSKVKVKYNKNNNKSNIIFPFFT